MRTPNLNPRAMMLELDYVNSLLGVKLTGKDVKHLLGKMRYDVVLSGKKIGVKVPAYRTDVLHPIDLVEDVAIAYGYDKFNPQEITSYTRGSKDPLEVFSSRIRDLMVGVGFQEVMTLVMSNKKDLFDRMNLVGEDVVETENPVSQEHSVARSWLLPSLFVVLEKNKNREYPQRIFEVGDCITSRGFDMRRLAAVVAQSKTNYSEIKSTVTGLLESVGAEYSIKALNHGSFIPGRCAGFDCGVFGEIHPKVLVNYGLEVPVTAFEVDLEGLVSGRR